MVVCLSLICRAFKHFEPSDFEEHCAGEVTLTGRVLPVGGIKEKLLAARRCGIQNIIFPGSNRKDYEELNGEQFSVYHVLRASSMHF